MDRVERPAIIFGGEAVKIGDVQKTVRDFFERAKHESGGKFTEADQELLHQWFKDEYRRIVERMRGKDKAGVLGPPIDSAQHPSIISSVLGELRIKTDQIIRDHDVKAERLNPLLYTKSGMRKRLEELREKIKGEHKEGKRKIIVLANIDLDDFKMVNDNFDHTVGDEVLRRVGDALERSVRPEDAVAHYSGDEFAIMMEMEVDGTDDDTKVQELIEKVLKRVIERMQAFQWEKEIVPGQKGIRPDGKKQELSVGYQVIEADQSGSFEDYSKESDSASELSKILRIMKEVSNETIESADRVVAADRVKEIEESLNEEDRKDAKFIRDIKRGYQERFPEIPRDTLFEMAKANLEKDKQFVANLPKRRN